MSEPATGRKLHAALEEARKPGGPLAGVAEPEPENELSNLLDALKAVGEIITGAVEWGMPMPRGFVWRLRGRPIIVPMHYHCLVMADSLAKMIGSLGIAEASINEIGQATIGIIARVRETRELAIRTGIHTGVIVTQPGAKRLIAVAADAGIAAAKKAKSNGSAEPNGGIILGIK
jgi:hypothetical protein